MLVAGFKRSCSFQVCKNKLKSEVGKEETGEEQYLGI